VQLFAGQENSVASTLNGSTSTDGSSPSVSAGEASLDARLDQYWELVHAQLNLQRPLTFLDALALDEAYLFFFFPPLIGHFSDVMSIGTIETRHTGQRAKRKAAGKRAATRLF